MASVPENAGVLYEVINLVNGKGYAGKDMNPLIKEDGTITSRRPRQHFAAASRGDEKCRLISRAIRKHGEHNFYFITHPDLLYSDALAAGEKELIRVREYYTDRNKGYNLTEGGEGTPGLKHTRETRDKWSAMRKGVPKTPEHAEAVRRACAQPEIKAKHLAATRKSHARVEVRDKISASTRGVPKTPEHVMKVIVAKARNRRARCKTQDMFFNTALCYTNEIKTSIGTF